MGYKPIEQSVIEEMNRLINEGKTKAEIHRILKVSKATVSRYTRKTMISKEEREKLTENIIRMYKLNPGITQKVIAISLEIEQATVSRALKGIPPNPKVIKKLVRIEKPLKEKIKKEVKTKEIKPPKPIPLKKEPEKVRSTERSFKTINRHSDKIKVELKKGLWAYLEPGQDIEERIKFKKRQYNIE